VLFWAALAPVRAAGEDERPTGHAVVHLVDGTVLEGRIVDQTDSVITFEHAILGRFEITQLSVREIEWETVSEPSATDHWLDDPSENSILLTPTPATLPKGTGYFRSIELFLLNFGYAPTDNLNLAAGILFPVSSEIFPFMVGAKLRVLDRERRPFGLALAASYTYFDELRDDGLGTVSAVAGIGDTHRSLNVTVGTNIGAESPSALYMLGADAQVSRGTKFVVEVGSSSALLFDDDDYDGLLNLGFRFFGERMAFTLTGFRPLGDSSGLFLFPLAVFSINW
jgi:hypothetical protein